MDYLQPDGKNRFRISRHGSMKADVTIYLNQPLYRAFSEDQSLQQLIDAASLPGVINPVVGMPDIHTGFGLPIGGVMAMDSATGLVSAGAVGMDINCGVRLLATSIGCNELDRNGLRALITAINRKVPSGIGQKSKHAPLVKKHFTALLEEGAPFLVKLGFGRPADLEATEDGGSRKGANLAAVSKEAKDRGLQLSTIGGGNHFIEIGCVAEIFDSETASVYGLEKDTLTVLIHTGSRGFGHQVCTDFTALMQKAAPGHGLKIPTPGLAAVPIDSREGKDYLAAMACAINFAFCNRQWITDDVRLAFAETLGGKDADYGLELIYDVAHNTARFEEIRKQKMLVHRKGATRALPAGHPGNSPRYLQTGHPVLVPGSMGSSSYVIRAGSGLEEAYYSVNHGAGRVLSRRAAKRKIDVEQLREKLGPVILSGRNYRAYLDEAPQAYKDIDQVVGTLADIGLSQTVARLEPMAVIKGEGGD